MTGALAICAKSRWEPTIRREHELAQQCAARDVETHFVESPTDIRSIRQNPRWLITNAASYRCGAVSVHPRRAVVPGHRGHIASNVECAALGRRLRRVAPELDAVVVNAPWNWSAVSALPTKVRRVVDLADDWRALIPQRADLILKWYRRIDAEADEIIVVNPDLQQAFSRPVTVIPNGVSSVVLDAEPLTERRERHLVYVGTLSERFDVALVRKVLESLPDWTMSIYGPQLFGSVACKRHFDDLLRSLPSRVSWRGVLDRTKVAAAVDEADVAVIPNDGRVGRGQDSMKLYDYVARGRPVVAAGMAAAADLPSTVRLAESATEFADAIVEASGTSDPAGRVWCAQRTWTRRAEGWLDTVFGVNDQQRWSRIGATEARATQQ